MGSFATVAIVAAGLGLMYVLCIRPVRSGHAPAAKGCCGPSGSGTDRQAEIEDLKRQISGLRTSQNDQLQ